ncbi:MAG: hypothetical protein Q9200_001404 [Gallowayella weberi]
MHQSFFLITLAALPTSFALPQNNVSGGVLEGYATFNKYSAQATGLNCIPELWPSSSSSKRLGHSLIQFFNQRNPGSKISPTTGRSMELQLGI